jgi:hypothetical protein
MIHAVSTAAPPAHQSEAPGKGRAAGSIFLRIAAVTLAVKVSMVLEAFRIGQWEPSAWLTVFWRFDTDWYARVAREGHQRITPRDLRPHSENGRTPSYYAFFPLYPLLIAGVMRATGLGMLQAAWWISLVASPAAFYLFYRIAHVECQDPRRAWFSTLAIMLFPFNYYYYVFYTEALYLLLLLACFWFVQQRRPVLLGASAIMLALIRPNGVMAGLPLLLWHGERHDRGFRKLLHGDLRSAWPTAVGLLLLVGTFAGYCLYLQRMTGDALAFSTAQAGWLRHFKWPWATIGDASGALDPLFAFFSLAMFLWVAATASQWRTSFLVLMACSTLLPLSTGVNTSMPRYWSTVFPLFLCVGRPLSQSRRPYRALLLWGLALLGLCIPWITESDFAV